MSKPELTETLTVKVDKITFDQLVRFAADQPMEFEEYLRVALGTHIYDKLIFRRLQAAAVAYARHADV